MYFYFPFKMPCNFLYWKPNMIYHVIKTEVNRSLVRGLVLIFLETALFLMYFVAIDTKGFGFFCYPSLFSSLMDFSNSSLNRVFYSSFVVIYCYHFGACWWSGKVYRGRKHSTTLSLYLSLLVCLSPGVVTFRNVS